MILVHFLLVWSIFPFIDYAILLIELFDFSIRLFLHELFYFDFSIPHISLSLFPFHHFTVLVFIQLFLNFPFLLIVLVANLDACLIYPWFLYQVDHFFVFLLREVGIFPNFLFKLFLYQEVSNQFYLWIIKLTFLMLLFLLRTFLFHKSLLHFLLWYFLFNYLMNY